MKVYRILIFSFIFLLFNTANAQETWFFELNDGKVIEGELTKRGFHSGEKKIDFRNKKTKKKEHIESTDLAKITSVIEGDTTVYTKVKQAYKTKKKFKYYNGLYWATPLYASDKLEAYMTIEKRLSTSQVPGGPRTTKIDYYAALNFRATSNDYLFLVGPFSQDANSFNSKKAFSKIMSTTLKVALADSCPSFTEGLDKHSYLMHEYEKVVDDYTAKCK